MTNVSTKEKRLLDEMLIPILAAQVELIAFQFTKESVVLEF